MLHSILLTYIPKACRKSSELLQRLLNVLITGPTKSSLKRELNMLRGDIQTLKGIVKQSLLKDCRVVFSTLGSIPKLIREMFPQTDTTTTTDSDTRASHDTTFTVVLEEASTLMSYHFASILMVQ